MPNATSTKTTSKTSRHHHHQQQHVTSAEKATKRSKSTSIWSNFSLASLSISVLAPLIAWLAIGIGWRDVMMIRLSPACQMTYSRPRYVDIYANAFMYVHR